MVASRLSQSLLRDGMVRAEAIEAAAARQVVYGGGLDTALLELAALDEPTLWTALSEASQMPVPAAALFESPDPRAAGRFDVAWSRRCRAVPVGENDGRLQLLCTEPIDEPGLTEACMTLEISCEIYVVPEVRLAAARQAVYGEPVPPRLLRLLARLVGPQAVRRWLESQNGQRPTPAAEPEPGAVPTAEVPEAGGVPAATEFDVSIPSFSRASATPVGRARLVVDEPPPIAASAPEPAPAPPRAPEPGDDELCAAAQDATAEARLPALRALRARLGHPRVRALTEKLRRDLAGPAEVAVLAADSLAELRDIDAVPALLPALQGPAALSQTAHRALVEITKQDFGTSRRRWNAWWERHQGESRIEWLFEGLSHKSPEIRFASSEELRVVTGEYFGYHFDLPKREREEATERWRAWWRESGRGG